jgi:hypothetical protein
MFGLAFETRTVEPGRGHVVGSRPSRRGRRRPGTRADLPEVVAVFEDLALRFRHLLGLALELLGPAGAAPGVGVAAVEDTREYKKPRMRTSYPDRQ